MAVCSLRFHSGLKVTNDMFCCSCRKTNKQQPGFNLHPKETGTEKGPRSFNQRIYQAGEP